MTALANRLAALVRTLRQVAAPQRRPWPQRRRRGAPTPASVSSETSSWASRSRDSCRPHQHAVDVGGVLAGQRPQLGLACQHRVQCLRSLGSSARYPPSSAETSTSTVSDGVELLGQRLQRGVVGGSAARSVPARQVQRGEAVAEPPSSFAPEQRRACGLHAPHAANRVPTAGGCRRPSRRPRRVVVPQRRSR